MARRATKGRAVLPVPDLETLAASRVAIEAVDPELDGGRFPARAVIGRPFTVEADVFCDGHDTIRAALLHRQGGSDEIVETEMTPLVNDRWRATVRFDALGPWGYTIIAWRDLYADWRKGTGKKIGAGLDVTLEMEEGRQLIAAAEAAQPRPSKPDRAEMRRLLAVTQDMDTAGRTALLMSEPVLELMLRAGAATNVTRYDRELAVLVDREAAAFSAWYELFPRSWGKDGRHGTFRRRYPTPRLRRRPRLRRALLPADPPDRDDQPQGPQQHPDAGAGRPRFALRHRLGRRRAHGGPPRARHHEGLRGAGEGGAQEGHRDRHRRRAQRLPRPSVDQGASRMVRLAPRRHHQVRREPAEEVRGHRQFPLLPRGVSRRSGTRCGTCSRSGSSAASPSSASTIRTPSPTRSGNG